TARHPGSADSTHRVQRAALCDPRDVQGHTQFIMQLEPQMVALGFMAGRESAVEREVEGDWIGGRRGGGGGGGGRGERGGKRERKERKRERKTAAVNRRASGPDTGAIFPWNELYASRGSRCIIYRSAFHYFFVV
ncbi:hypothetical protein ALC56_00141, partial [Trachymyrmex septentrionalis]